MRIFKKIIIIYVILMCLLQQVAPGSFAAESSSNGGFQALTDVQRAGLVKYATSLVEGLGTINQLRYSVEHRKSGYNLTRVAASSTKPATSIRYVTLEDADKQRVLDALKQAVQERYGHYTSKTYREVVEQYNRMTIDELTPTYVVELLGEAIGGTLAFDSSSLVASIYKNAWGVSLEVGREPWTTKQFREDKTFFTSRTITDFSTVKPGDLILSGKQDENGVWVRRSYCNVFRKCKK